MPNSRRPAAQGRRGRLQVLLPHVRNEIPRPQRRRPVRHRPRALKTTHGPLPAALGLAAAKAGECCTNIVHIATPLSAQIRQRFMQHRDWCVCVRVCVCARTHAYLPSARPAGGVGCEPLSRPLRKMRACFGKSVMGTRQTPRAGKDTHGRAGQKFCSSCCCPSNFGVSTG